MQSLAPSSSLGCLATISEQSDTLSHPPDSGDCMEQIPASTVNLGASGSVLLTEMRCLVPW